MISQEEYASIREKIEEEDRLKWARKVVTIGSFTISGRCPNCDNRVHKDYNQKYCGNCRTPLKWSANED